MVAGTVVSLISTMVVNFSDSAVVADADDVVPVVGSSFALVVVAVVA